MCNLRHPVTGPDPGATAPGPAAPSQSPISGVNSSLDTSPAPPTSTTMQPTKFAKLMKVVAPMIQGGLIGGFGGNWRVPGSGSEAAGNFFQQQTENALRKKSLQNQTANIQSEQQWRQAEAQRAEAQAQGAGRIYQAEDATGERHNYRIKPDGSSENLGKDPFPQRFQSVNTADGIDVLDTRNGVMSPVPDEEPEEHGTLPLPGDTKPPQLQAPSKPTAAQRPIPLREGEELVSPGGQVLTPARPKTATPRAPGTRTSGTSAAEKTETQRKAETYADAILGKFNGDQDKSIAAVEQLKSLDPAMRAAVRKLIRDIKKPAPAKKFQRSADQMKRLAQAPPS